nr:hypothetical protein [Actinomyces urinae]
MNTGFVLIFPVTSREGALAGDEGNEAEEDSGKSDVVADWNGERGGYHSHQSSGHCTQGPGGVETVNNGASVAFLYAQAVRVLTHVNDCICCSAEREKKGEWDYEDSSPTLRNGYQDRRKSQRDSNQERAVGRYFSGGKTFHELRGEGPANDGA